MGPRCFSREYFVVFDGDSGRWSRLDFCSRAPLVILFQTTPKNIIVMHIVQLSTHLSACCVWFLTVILTYVFIHFVLQVPQSKYWYWKASREHRRAVDLVLVQSRTDSKLAIFLARRTFCGWTERHFHQIVLLLLYAVCLVSLKCQLKLNKPFLFDMSRSCMFLFVPFTIHAVQD